MIENRFDGDQLTLVIERLPRGKARIEAYQEAVRLADAAQDAYWQLGFRFDYAAELYFQDDPPKCIPVAAEFAPIFESAPAEIRTNDAMVQAYLMVTQMGVDVMQDLPQIPMIQYEEALEHYNGLTRRFGMGRRSYLWQMYNRWEYADSNRALEYMERVWQTPEDDSYGDCMACEYPAPSYYMCAWAGWWMPDGMPNPWKPSASPRVKALSRGCGPLISTPPWTAAIWRRLPRLRKSSIKRGTATGQTCAF